MLAGPGLAYAQLGVLAALPVDRQDDLTRRLVDIGDDLDDQRTKQLLARAHGDARRIPGRRRGLRPARQSPGRAMADPASARRPVGPRSACTRRSAASQLFSSCAAIRRLSGSQAA